MAKAAECEVTSEECTRSVSGSGWAAELRTAQPALDERPLLACELGIREHVVVSGNHWLSEDQVEQEKLSDPGDTEGEEIRSDDEGGSVDPTEVMGDSEMSRFSRGRDGKGDTHESHRPERHDLFHEMGAPGLPPGPSASQVVGRRNRHDVREQVLGTSVQSRNTPKTIARTVTENTTLNAETNVKRTNRPPVGVA